MNADLISHIGTIKSINNHQFIVKITSQTACASCHAKGSCSSSEQEIKEIEIDNTEGDFKIGEIVQVITTTSQGYTAVVMAYLLPLILLVVTLLIFLSFHAGEAIAATGALVILLPYYWLLYHFRDKIKSTFHFSLHKMSNMPVNE